MSEIERARSALHHLDPGMPREEWFRAATAALAAGLTVDDINHWSEPAANYQGRRDIEMQFRKVKPDGGISASTLYYMARERGWRDSAKSLRVTTRSRRYCGMHGFKKKASPKATNRTGSQRATEIWDRCEPATDLHWYIRKKQATGVLLDNLRVVPLSDNFRIAGERMAGALVVPVMCPDGLVSSLQFVPLPDVVRRLKAQGKSDKLNMPGCELRGWFVVGELLSGRKVYVCEGVGQAWACWLATGCATVSCFGWGRVQAVAAELRQRDPMARLILTPDVGKEVHAETIARELGAAVAYMPQGEAQNFDANDYMQRDGVEALAALLEAAREPAMALPLDVAFADEIPSTFTPTDELVEGMLTSDGSSVVYGDSNSGKTFFIIDIACAMARGVTWMGRQTEPGLIIYLAAESPASVCARLQAYQKHHHVRVPNFAVVQSPVNLFDNDADTEAVIQLVHQIEKQRNQKARLIIGDTLARLSAGANENSGQDMGLVVRRIDRIRTECQAHFLVIHHSGKSALAGARGWSGIRAAVDTEIEITDSPAGRCAEITKQRDLGTKGERIGFRLETVTLGLSKWKSVATSCVVVPADAPEKLTSKRTSEVGGAILEMLRARGSGMKKREVVKHFDGLYDRTAVYREMKKLVETAQLHEVAGIVAIVKGEGAKGAN